MGGNIHSFIFQLSLLTGPSSNDAPVAVSTHSPRSQFGISNNPKFGAEKLQNGSGIF